MRTALGVLAAFALAGAWRIGAAAPADDEGLSPVPDIAPATPDVSELTPLERQFVTARQFTSPITGLSFTADVLDKAVPVTNYDYDHCPHPLINSLAYSLVIDPECGYVAAPEFFEEPSTWDTPALAALFGEPRFNRVTPVGLPWAKAYAWEKFENAAKLAEAAEHSALDVGNLWLFAAWSVRLDVVSGQNVFDAEVQKLFGNLPQRAPDFSQLNTLYELQLAQYWEGLRNSGQLVDIDDASFAMALAWLFRSRGELLGADAWLSRTALSGGDALTESALYSYLQSSIELERDYLRTARRWLEQAYNDPAMNKAQEAGVAYMLAEINRRLGDLPSALHWYDQAKTRNLGALSEELLAQQRALVDGGRGY